MKNKFNSDLKNLEITQSHIYYFILKYECQNKLAHSLDPSPQPLNPPTYFLSYSTHSKDKVSSKTGYKEHATYFRPDPRETDEKDTYRATSL